MKYIFNPFTTLPFSLCDDRLPLVPACQTGTNYPQYLSQICAIILLPVTADPPTDWTSADAWAAVIDNDDYQDFRAKYLVVKGSFSPQNTTEIQLSGGRAVETRARLYRFSGSTWNMNSGHMRLARRFQDNVRGFTVWLETLGGRLIGGETGMMPFFVDAEPILGGGNEDRERIDFTIDFYLSSFPEALMLDFAIGDPEAAVAWRQEDLENWMGELLETDWMGE